MKTMKKIISLTMAVIMLITGSPVLQASDLALDRAQMAGLQQEILQDVKINVPNPVRALKALHDKATENNKARLAEFNEKIQGEALEAVKEHLNGLKEQAKALAKSEEYLIVPKPERLLVAFNTLLSVNLDSDCERKIREISADITLGLSVSDFVIGVALKVVAKTPGITAEAAEYLSGIASGFFRLSLIFFLIRLIEELFIESYTPTIAPSLNAEETSRIFSEKPFTFLATFENEAEYANLYKKCPELLNDAVTIEYYTSLASVTAEDIKDMSYIGTLGWYKMTTEERSAYLHNFAERLRAEAKAGAKQQFNNSKIGLEER